MKKQNLIIVLLLIVGVGILLFIGDRTNLSKAMPTDTESDMELKMQLNINGVNFTATLLNNETVKVLLNSLPLTISMNELNGNEKYHYLNFALPTNASYTGIIKKGDIMLFGSDCLVIFYKEFTTNYKYTKIGTIDNVENLAEVLDSSKIEVTITK